MATGFDEVQFPVKISWGCIGGPTYETVVVEGDNQSEQRFSRRSVGLLRWRVDQALKTRVQIAELIAFFRVRRGKAYGFRFKDWLDYTAIDEPLVLDGSPSTQLIKTYTSGARSELRLIKKPIAGITMERSAVAFTDFTLDTTTGIITLTVPDSSKAITGITVAASAVVTSVAHGYLLGDFIYFKNVVGMTQINGLVGEVTNVGGANVFTVNINSSAFTAYSSGGLAEYYVQPGEDLTWSGEFDVPVRFEQDTMDVSREAPDMNNWNSITLVELVDA